MSDEDEYLSEESYEFEFEDDDDAEVSEVISHGQESAVCQLCFCSSGLELTR